MKGGFVEVELVGGPHDGEVMKVQSNLHILEFPVKSFHAEDVGCERADKTPWRAKLRHVYHKRLGTRKFAYGGIG